MCHVQAEAKPFSVKGRQEQWQELPTCVEILMDSNSLLTQAWVNPTVWKHNFYMAAAVCEKRDGIIW